jgi:hypothetical protein
MLPPNSNVLDTAKGNALHISHISTGLLCGSRDFRLGAQSNFLAHFGGVQIGDNGSNNFRGVLLNKVLADLVEGTHLGTDSVEFSLDLLDGAVAVDLAINLFHQVLY